ncbi:MAG: hydantoinase B/oxoprolinase family protein [Candidatus Binatia bacterium]
MPVVELGSYVDPITFEVIQHRLWQINDEQSFAIKTISASPIVVEGNDFNVGLFTADGQIATTGIGSLVHVATMGSALKSIMKLASHIREGDAYLTNDPFLGALHQNDVVIAGALFWKGEVVMWVGNVLHHPDVGGIDEGSFCINARNLYQDPPRYFLKIVDQGELVTEVERTFVTNSRLPDMVALDLRAQIGAIHVAKARIYELLDEYGGEVVQTVMHQSIDIAEQQIRDRIASLPEGCWSGEAYMDGDRVGSDKIHKVQASLTREEDTLHFDYTGSSPQVDAAVNCTYHACLAGTTVPLYTFLCQGDIDWNEGLKRCIRVTAPEGTVVNARFPAPVSICTVGFRWLVTVAATQAVAKMMGASTTYRDRVCASWNSSSNCNNVFGTTPEGKRVGALLSDHRGGGAAARSFDDGFSHAGQVTSFSGNLGNVEAVEWKLPLIYVFRQQLIDSGGTGMYRGGLTACAAIVPYGVEELLYKSTNTAGTDESNAHGLDGGYPGAGSQVTVIRDSQVWERLCAGRSPLTYEEFGGKLEHMPSKSNGVLRPSDVLIFFAPGGGGYGDPLDRNPERVGRDVENGWVSVDRARESYGVVLSEDGTVDQEKTAGLREQVRQARRQGGITSWSPTDHCINPHGLRGEPWRVGENLELIPDGHIQILRCRRCRHPLSGPRGRVITTRVPLGKAGPWLALRWHGDSIHFALEEIICPSCATLLSVREIRIDQ